MADRLHGSHGWLPRFVRIQVFAILKMIRAVILSATLAALFCMWMDRPAPVKSVKVDYCKLDTGSFAPCSGLKYSLNI